MFKKFITSFLLAVIILVSCLTPYAYAQETSPWYMQDFKQWYVKVYDQSNPQEIFGERYTAAQVQWVIYGLVSFLLNTDKNIGNITCIFSGGSVDSCLEQTPIFLGFAGNGTPEKESGVLATLFPEDRQLSGVNYVRSKLTSLHIIPQAYAQGVGFSALGPIQNIWKVFRDIMYGFFVIIIIIFSFMIMFRTKISPQTVVTVQSALPKILITLILVTFSYAIAGFLLDLMYVVIGILALIFSNISFNGRPFFAFELGGAWAGFFRLLTLGPGDPGPNGILGWFVGYWWPFVRALAGVAYNQIGLTAWGVLSLLLSILLMIGVLIWLIVTLVKVFILLIKTYLMVLISVIFAPFIIGFGAVMPTGGFKSWLTGLISNLAVYPVVGALLMLSVMFLSSTYPGVRNSIADWLEDPSTGNITITSPFEQPADSKFWYPPLTLGQQSGPWDPLPTLWLFASLGILALIPNVANIIKSLMAGKGVEAGGGIGAAFGAIGGYALGAGKTTGGGIFTARERALEREIAGAEIASKRPFITPADYDTQTDIIKARSQKLYGAQKWRKRIGM